MSNDSFLIEFRRCGNLCYYFDKSGVCRTCSPNDLTRLGVKGMRDPTGARTRPTLGLYNVEPRKRFSMYSKVKVGDTFDELKSKLEEYPMCVEEDSIENLITHVEPPRLTKSSDTGTCSFIYLDICLRSSFPNRRQFVISNRKSIVKEALRDSGVQRRFKRYGIDPTKLRCTSARYLGRMDLLAVILEEV